MKNKIMKVSIDLNDFKSKYPVEYVDGGFVVAEELNVRVIGSNCFVSSDLSKDLLEKYNLKKPFTPKERNTNSRNKR